MLDTSYTFSMKQQLTLLTQGARTGVAAMVMVTLCCMLLVAPTLGAVSMAQAAAATIPMPPLPTTPIGAGQPMPSAAIGQPVTPKAPVVKGQAAPPKATAQAALTNIQTALSAAGIPTPLSAAGVQTALSAAGLSTSQPLANSQAAPSTAQVLQPVANSPTAPSTATTLQPVASSPTQMVADAPAVQAAPPPAKSSTKAAAKAKAGAKKPLAPPAPSGSRAVPTPAVPTGPQADAAAAYQAGDYAKAHEIWQNLAGESDPRAMYNLGVLYDKGQGVSEDPTLAAFWFLKSAEAGHTAGMSNLGRLLEQGRGLKRDLPQAAQWFRKAADSGLAEAQYNLAVLYERGLGLEKSDREAAAWYSQAAAQNQTDAQGRLGQMYREGRGVSKNATRAVLLLYGASMDGNTDAIRGLEEMALDPEFKGKAAPSRPNPVVLFGVPLEHATRDAMRQVMAASKVPVVREDSGYICDVYNVRAAIPGATEMAACYGPGAPQPLGFVKIDYPSPDKQQTEKVTGMLSNMLVERFGPPAATEGQGAALWNLGKVIVAVQHSPATKETGLMYMVPRVYHLTRDKK